MSALRVVAAAAAVALAGGPALADGYGTWKKDEAKKTYTCTYGYDAKDPAAGKKEQQVVVYYADKDRSAWAYYYNADQKPWARCALPGNPKYSEKAMYWEALKPDASGYEPFKDKSGNAYGAGYCPAPKDGKRPIADLPLPPK